MMLLVLAITDFLNTNSRHYVYPDIIKLKDLNQGNEQAMLLGHPVPSAVSETHRSRFLILQEENVMEHHHA